MTNFNPRFVILICVSFLPFFSIFHSRKHLGDADSLTDRLERFSAILRDSHLLLRCLKIASDILRENCSASFEDPVIR